MTWKDEIATGGLVLALLSAIGGQVALAIAGVDDPPDLHFVAGAIVPALIAAARLKGGGS